MDKATQLELQQRVELIENLVRQSRQDVEQYGWIFLLWGLGHALCLGWDCLQPMAEWRPWSIVMPICGVLTFTVGWGRRRRQRVRTVVARAVGLVWVAATPVLFLITPLVNSWPIANTPEAQAHAFIGFCLVIGMPNMACGLILRWWSHILAGLLWWLGAIALTQVHSMTALVAVAWVLIVLCEIAFGAHLMRQEALSRREAAHA